MNEMQNSKLLGMGIQQGKGRTKDFDINLTEIDEKYVGRFKVHHPSIIDKMNIGVLKTKMLQGLAVDVVTDNIAHMTATLTFVLDDFPEWFKVNEIYDYEVLEAVYDEYAEWYNSFRKPSGNADDKGDSEKS
jgi:hypothetical protein